MNQNHSLVVPFRCAALPVPFRYSTPSTIQMQHSQYRSDAALPVPFKCSTPSAVQMCGTPSAIQMCGTPSAIQMCSTPSAVQMCSTPSAVQMCSTPSAITSTEHYPIQLHFPVSIFVSNIYSAFWVGFPYKTAANIACVLTWRIFAAHHNLLEVTILLLWASMTFALTFYCE
jgi:hypothetical protein